MRFKKAFTLAETLLVFIIIGIVASVGVSTLKPWEKSYKYAYSKIYNSLGVTMFNYMATKNTTDGEAFPKDSGELCCAILEYMNAAGSHVYPNVRQTICDKSNGEYTVNSLHVCSKRDLDKDPAYVNAQNPFARTDSGLKMLKLSNSTYMWFASANGKKPFESGTLTDSLGIKYKFKYYIVFVDLNGDRRPNSPQWTNNVAPDIVAFAITDQYTILPLGYPQFDTRYLSAHVIYPAINDNEDGDSDDTETVSDPLTFYEARVKAYSLNIPSTAMISSTDLFSLDYEDVINMSDSTGSGHFFRIKNIANRYETAPTFESDLCMQKELGTNTQIKQPVCEVRIYDYN